MKACSERSATRFRIRPATLIAGLLFCAGLVAAGPIQPAAADFDDATEFKLPNGLTVVVASFPAELEVTQVVVFKVGSADTPPGKSVLARLVQGLLYKNGIEGGRATKATDSNYSSSNHDTTYFARRVPPAQLPGIMLEGASLMSNDLITDRTVDEERESQRVAHIWPNKRDPAAPFNALVRQMLYLNHPYRLPWDGLAEDVAGLTTTDAVAFHRAYYAPNNALLVLAGAITAQQARDLAWKYFGTIGARPVPPRHWLQEPPSPARRSFTYLNPHPNSLLWQRQYRAPSYRMGPPETVYALHVLKEFLSNPLTGPFAHKPGSPAIGFASLYSPLGSEYSTFILLWGGYSSPIAMVAETEQKIDTVIESVRRDGITDAELANAKMMIERGGLLETNDFDHTVSVALRLGAGETLSDLAAWRTRLAAVSKEDVKAAARTILDPNNSVTAMGYAPPDADNPVLPLGGLK